MPKKFLKSRSRESVELGKLKTKLNMLEYYLHQQIRYHEPAYGNPDTNVDMAVIGLCKTIIGKLNE